MRQFTFLNFVVNHYSDNYAVLILHDLQMLIPGRCP